MFKTAVSFAANFAVHPVRTDLILRFADVLSLNERNTLMMMNSIFIEPHTQRYTHGSRLEVIVVNSPIFVTLANGEILLKGEYSVGLKIYIWFNILGETRV